MTRPPETPRPPTRGAAHPHRRPAHRVPGPQHRAHRRRRRGRPRRAALAADVAAGLGPRAHRQPGGAVAGARRRRPRSRCAPRSTACTTPSSTPAPAASSCRCSRPARRAPTWPRCGTRRWTCSGRSPHGRPPALDHGFAFGMIVQHEQQHDETMLATHQLRAGRAGAAAPPAAARAAVAARARCWCRPGRSRWAPPPSRGRWTTSGPRTSSTCPRSVIDTAPVTGGGVRRVRRGRRLPRSALVERRPAGRTAPRPGWPRRGSGRATATARGGGAGSASVEPVPLDQPVVHVCCARGRRLRRAGRAARLPTEAEWEKAAPLRPGHRPLPPLPVGRRRPDPEHANLGQRHLRPAPVGAYPAGASPLGVAAADRRRLGVDGLGLAPVPGLRGRSRTPSTPRCSSAATTGCCAAARSAPTRRPCRATFRNWDLPIRRQIFAGFRLRAGRAAEDARAVTAVLAGCAATWPTWARRCRSRRWCSTRRTGCCGSPTRRATCAAAAPSTPTGSASGWYPGRRTGDARSATAAPRRSGRTPSFADLAARDAHRRVLAAVRSATVGMPVTATAAAPVRRGPLAVQPQRRGPRLAGRRWPALAAAAAGHRPAHPRRRPPTRRCCGRWCAHRLRAGDDAGRRAGRRRRRGRGRRARARGSTCCSPTAPRSGPPPGTTRCPCAPRPTRVLVASEPLDDRARLGPAVPDRHLRGGPPRATAGSARSTPTTGELMSAAPARHPPHRRRRRGRAARRRPRRADRARPKHLPPKWFYDARGSELFEEITRLPEYYPTRTERALLAGAVDEIAARPGPTRSSSWAPARR